MDWARVQPRAQGRGQSEGAAPDDRPPAESAWRWRSQARPSHARHRPLLTARLSVFQFTARTFDRRHRLGSHEDVKGTMRRLWPQPCPGGLPLGSRPPARTPLSPPFRPRQWPAHPASSAPHCPRLGLRSQALGPVTSSARASSAEGTVRPFPLPSILYCLCLRQFSSRSFCPFVPSFIVTSPVKVRTVTRNGKEGAAVTSSCPLSYTDRRGGRTAARCAARGGPLPWGPTKRPRCFYDVGLTRHKRPREATRCGFPSRR